MLCCGVLCCAVLYRTVLSCAVVCWTVLYCAVLFVMSVRSFEEKLRVEQEGGAIEFGYLAGALSVTRALGSDHFTAACTLLSCLCIAPRLSSALCIGLSCARSPLSLSLCLSLYCGDLVEQETLTPVSSGR